MSKKEKFALYLTPEKKARLERRYQEDGSRSITGFIERASISTWTISAPMKLGCFFQPPSSPIWMGGWGKWKTTWRRWPTNRRWNWISAAQGNVYAEALLQHQDSGRPPHVFLAVTRLLHHMSRIFQDRSLPQSGTGLQVDSKLRQKIKEKKIAMGHKADDHEDPELTQGGMGGMTGY